MTINFLPTLSYPQNQSTNIPNGSTFRLVFDKEVDIESVRNSIILVGADFDRTTIPENALWINETSGENKNFLRSPNYKGFCEFDVEINFLDPVTKEIVLPENDFDRTNYYTAAVIKPKKALALNSEYQIFLIGSNTQNLDPMYKNNNAVSLRTIYSANLNNTVDERVKVRGLFKGENGIGSLLTIEIVESGIGNAAQYIYYFDDQNKNMERLSRCSARWRSVDKGLNIKFDNIQYNAGELITIKCYKPDFLEASYIINFSTNDGAIYIEPEPDYKSTSPVNTVLINNFEPLAIIKVTPHEGAINIPLSNNLIEIHFNKLLDPASVTQDSVKIEVLPVSGYYNNMYDSHPKTKKLYKIVSVVENKIIIEI